MVAVIGTLIFTGALALAMAVIWFSVAPQWRRILRLAAGHVEQQFRPLEALSRAERRIEIKRLAASPAPTAARMRVAA